MKIDVKKGFFFIICCCFIFCYSYFYSRLFNDEIWNYGFAYNISLGMIPYRDFNMIITPFYAFLSSLFIVLFGHHLWSIHILNAIMISSMLFIMWDVLKEKVLLVFPVILLYCYPGYNLFSLFLVIIFIYICDKKNPYQDLVMGLLCSVLFLTKQTVGFCFMIPTIYYAKNKMKCFISFSVPIMIFLIYLIYHQALYSFLDYCFLGMFDFSTANKILFFLPIEIVICIILLFSIIKSRGKNRQIFYILMYQIITIPIMDDYHFMIGFIPVLYYWLEYVELKKYKIKYYFLIVLFVIMYWNYLSNGYGTCHYYSDKSSYLYGRYVDQYIEDSISVISEYMEKVKSDYDSIFLFTQNSYEIKMNTSYLINKFDLINNGNMGYHGSFKYIDEIENTCLNHRCLFIVYKYEINFEDLNANQTNVDIIDFVYKNYPKKEEVDVFEIFESVI